MKIINCDQNSDDWQKCRLGKFTASDAQAISANGAGLKTLVYKKVAELLTQKTEQGYISQAMERGHELEILARNDYELKTDNTVTEVGFCELDEFTGCSPDGLVGKDKLTEFKCLDDKSFVEILDTQKIDTAYEWQMQYQMMVTGRQECDYVVYNPNFKNTLIIINVKRNEQSIAKIQVGLNTGIAMVKTILEKINNLK